MNYLQVENISKSFGDLELFNNISFTIYKDQRVALIAKNGTGKTSLLKIMGGQDTPDDGQIIFRNDVTVGYLEQEPLVNPELTVMDEVFSSSSEVVRAIKEYEAAIKIDNSERLNLAMHQMDTLNAWDYEIRIKQILGQLKITEFDKKVGEMSGGQKKRLALANVLINDPDILILDEPTNHLDLDMIEWLEGFLKSSKSTLFMVTHDRYFLDRVCDVIYELDDNQLFRYKGNYSYFLEKRDERINSENQEIDKAKSLFKKELDWVNRSPSARSTKAKYRVDSFYKTKETASKRRNQDEVKLEVQSARLGKKILEMYNLKKSFGDLSIINNFSYKFERGEKIGIIGENGTGKSTFLNIITNQIPLDSGRIETGSTVVMGYYKQDGITFDENKKVIEVIQDLAEEINMGDGRKLSPLQFLNYFLFPPKTHYAFVRKLSGGEKRRLYLMTVLIHNPNFLLLDEPTNDLDIMTLNILEDYLADFKGCVVIVSHDRFFMDKIVDHLFVFEGQGNVKDFPGNYSQYREDTLKKKALKQKVEKEEAPKKQEKTVQEKKKLSYKEQQEFNEINESIENLENEKTQIETGLSDASLQGDELIQASQRLLVISKELEEKEDRWLYLSQWTE
ncbi:MAG: ABC-F family ATP-binding cassette domain-containing protein [Salinivirgaceae bacterium]|nr:ABC-F family ATP-binding cassette domain-containing protein [Salinivirgaceae bacterium]